MVDNDISFYYIPDYKFVFYILQAKIISNNK